MESLVNKSSPSWAFAKERGFSVWFSFSATSNPFTWSRYTHIGKDKVFSVKIKGHEQGHTKDWWLHEGSGLSITRSCCPLCARHCAEWEMAQGRQKWLRGSTRPWRIHAGASPLLPSSVAPVRSPGISKSLRPVVVARSPRDLTVLLRWWPSLLSLSSTCAQELQDLICLTSPPTAASATFIPFTESQSSKCWEAPGPTPGTFSHSTLCFLGDLI